MPQSYWAYQGLKHPGVSTDLFCLLMGMSASDRDRESNPGIQACLSCFGGCPFWIWPSHHLLHFDIGWGWDAIHLSTSPLGKQSRTLVWEKKDHPPDVIYIPFFLDSIKCYTLSDISIWFDSKPVSRQVYFLLIIIRQSWGRGYRLFWFYTQPFESI